MRIYIKSSCIITVLQLHDSCIIRSFFQFPPVMQKIRNLREAGVCQRFLLTKLLGRQVQFFP